jgi:hypothetical protein
MIKIDNWMVVPRGDVICLFGNVYGHPRFTDGDEVRTSYVLEVDKRKVFTRSGSEYRLGKISPYYKKILKKYDSKWDWRNPLKKRIECTSLYK